MNNLEELLKQTKNTTENSPYSQCIISSKGFLIPQFSNGTHFYSKYNPFRESDFFLEDTEIQESDFLIFFGFGFGYQLEKILDSFPTKQFLVIEENSAAYSFIFSQISPEKFSDKNIIFATFENLAESIKNYFNPLFHSKICIKTMRSWEDFYKQTISYQKDIIFQAFQDKILDTKTQSHFGKQWNTNFWKNLYLLKNYEDAFKEKSFEYLVNKKLVVTAAGPSLDKNINNLKLYRDALFILATDTSLPVLQKHKIIPNAVITIDAQEYSLQHYHCLPKETAIFMDLCSSHNIALNALKNNNPLFFIQNGHPLIQYFSLNYQKEFFPKIDCGNGTVTIAALSLAHYLQFEDITLLGADFSFPFNKAYANGTYFENNFIISQSRFNSFELNQTTIYLGKETLIEENSIPTTALLKNYKQSLKTFLTNKGIILNNFTEFKNFSSKKNIYLPNLPTKQQINTFILNFLTENIDQPLYTITLQPLLHFYKKENPTLSFEELIIKVKQNMKTLLLGVLN